MKATNAGHAFGVVVVDELVRHGVHFACMSPGSRSTPLALAFAEHPDIELAVAHDERSSAFIALGMARVSNVPVPIVTTSGTAAANLLPAVVEADLSRVPLILLTADRPGELRATGANQSIDQVKLYGDAVRWFCEVGVPETLETSTRYWRSLASHAVASATVGPAGPVHLNCAFREPLVPTDDVFPYPVDGRDAGAPWTSVKVAPRILPTHEIDHLVERLESATAGIVVAGPGAGSGEALAGLAEALAWPLLADPLSNARIGANAISTYDSLLRSTGFVAEHRPDVVLRVGQLGISKSLMRFVGGAGLQILLDADGRAFDPDRSTHEIIAADVTTTVEALVARLSHRRSDSGWIGSWRTADATARAAIDGILDGIAQPSEPRTARDVVAALPDGSALFVGASMPLRDVEWFAPVRDGVTFFCNRGANGIDGSVSTPIGIGAASGSPTYALIGDISLLHDQNGLLSSLTPTTDVTIVCVNNDGGGIFSFLPQAEDPEHFENLFGTPHRRDLSRVAQLHGCEHVLVEAASELSQALHRSEPGVRIVEVRTDRAANVDLHRELASAVDKALGR